MLVKELGPTELRLETQIDKIEQIQQGYRVYTNTGALDCKNLVIATGGKSIPKMGATALDTI